MYRELLDFLACPVDLFSPLELEVLEVCPDGEITEGMLHCPTCARVFPIRESIPMFMPGLDSESDRDEVSWLKAQEQKQRDAEANDYDSRTHESVASAELKGITRLLNIENSHALIDLGCGTGRITMIIAKMARMTVGVDFSFTSLKVFEKRIPPDYRDRVHLVQADIFHLPFRDQVLHRVASNGVFEHLPGLPDDKRPVLEAVRVLLDQGIFVLSIYNYSRLRAFLTRLFPILT